LWNNAGGMLRKLKLQVQMTVDGFVAGSQGEMDWMIMSMDQGLQRYIQDITENVDCILLGRALAQQCIPVWEARLKDPATADAFARKMVNTPKVVFSKAIKALAWDNAVLADGDLEEVVRALKRQPGKDMIAYGGAEFASNLIRLNLIDEYHLFINPVALGSGMAIFQTLEDKQRLYLGTAMPFPCGIVVLKYLRVP
jgi:dihydrofolate reductase